MYSFQVVCLCVASVNRVKKSVLRGTCASGLRVSALPRARRRCRWMRGVLPTTGEESARTLMEGGGEKPRIKRRTHRRRIGDR